MKSIALILAGGKGSRLSKTKQKQFIIANGYSILEHTLKTFTESYSKNKVLIV